MKACELQIERLRVIVEELEQLRLEEEANAQKISACIADAKINLHEISMRCKTKYLRLVETASDKLDVARKETQEREAALSLQAATQAIRDFLGQAEVVVLP